MKYRVNLVLRQSWTVEIEADDENEAVAIANTLAIPADEPDYSSEEIDSVMPAEAAP